MFITEILVGILSILVLSIYISFKRKFKYWDRKNVTIIPNPVVPFGSVSDLIRQKKSMHELTKIFYNYLKNTKKVKYGGMYFFGSPSFLPIDLELMRNIMIKDASHFINLGLFHDENDPLSMILSNIVDDKWRYLRAATSHAYTSGKTKMMFKLMMDTSKTLEKIIQKSAVNKETIDIKDYISRYTMDINASVAFGLEINSMENPENNEFLEISKRIFEDNGWEALKMLAYFVAPLEWLRAVGFKITKPEVEKFFMDVVDRTVKHREKNGIERKDFMQMLIELKNTGIIKLTDSSDIIGDIQTSYKISMNEVSALAYEFYIAGFETSSTTTTFALLELSLNQEIQDKARKEIRTIVEKYNGNLTYEAFGEMDYLEQIIKETLRKYPPLAMLPRICNKDYKIPGSDFIIEKGTKIMIPITGLHYDPEFYEDPEEFRPERFEGSKKSIPNNYFFSFGEGPRICVGVRLGMIQTKVAMATVLKNHKVFLDKQKTIFPIEFEPKGEITSVRGGVWLNVTKTE